MSVPVFLNSSFYYFERTGVSDVQTIIDDFEHQVLVHNSPVWTKPSAGLYKSPVDADGRWYDVLLTRVTQQKLEMRLRDNAGATLCTRRINCPSANAWNVHIYTGSHHMFIAVDVVSSSWESLMAGILDSTPDAAHNKYLYGGGYRTNGDVNDAYHSCNRMSMFDNTTATLAERMTCYGGTTTSNAALTTQNGSRVYRPHGLWCKPVGDAGSFRFAGRRYQTLLVEWTMTIGSKVTVPIDSHLSGLFRVTSVPGSYGCAASMRIA